MTTAVSGLTRGEAHTRHSWTISLATGVERQLRHSLARASSRNVPRLGGVAETRHLPAAPLAAKRRSVHRKNGILQILLWEAELGSDHCQREERGRRLLKQQRPDCRSSRSSPRAAGDLGRGAGKWGLDLTCRNLTKRRCSPSASWPPEAVPPNVSFRKRLEEYLEGDFSSSPPPGAPPEFMATAWSCKAKEKRVPRDGRSRTAPLLAPCPVTSWGVSINLKEVLLPQKGKQSPLPTPLHPVSAPSLFVSLFAGISWPGEPTCGAPVWML